MPQSRDSLLCTQPRFVTTHSLDCMFSNILIYISAIGLLLSQVYIAAARVIKWLEINRLQFNSVLKIPAIFMKNQQIHLQSHKLSIIHTYVFRSPSATIHRMYSIKKYDKNLCVFVQDVFNTVHPEHGRSRRLKHVGVINKQRI